MAVVLNILDLLELSFATKLPAENIKEYSLKLLLQILIHRLNFTNLKIEFKGEDSEIIQKAVQTNSQYDTKTASPKIEFDSIFEPTDDFEVGLKNTSTIMENDEAVVEIESGKVIYNPKKTYTTLEKPLVSLQMKVSDNQSRFDKHSLVTNNRFQKKTTMDFEAQPIIQLFPSIIIPESQSSLEENRSSLTENLPSVVETQSSVDDNQSSGDDNMPLEEEMRELPSSIEGTLLLNEFSKEYEEFKNIINKMQEIFGKDIGETLKYIKQAADLADNNRLRQIYFHEEIYKKIQLPDADEDFTPIRKGPREIIIKKAIELAAELEEDQEAKIGDLSASKEKLLRDENLLLKLVEQVYASEKKSKEGPRWSVTKPVETPQDITINKLNELIKEHEDIKCYLEFLIYHVNTLADFSEISIPIIFANDPQMEGIQQRIREIRLTPSEYIITKKIQRELMEFYKTFISRIDNVENRLNRNSSLIMKHDDELYKKTATLSNSINEIQIVIKTINHDLEDIMENKNTNEGKVEGTLNSFQEEVNKMSKDQIIVFEKQRKMISQLRVLESSLLKLKDEIFKLKAVKLEKIELQKLLSTKADCSLLHSKVSETQFSLAYNDLTSSLNSISSQLGAQNFIWEALVKKMTDKLNIMVPEGEFKKYKKQVAGAMNVLQITLNKLQEKDDIEALGTKTKFLRNLTCVSCNKGRIMKVANDYPNFPALPKLPSKGYKKDPTGPDLQRNQSRSSSDFTDRYVGGNHTLIKPKEKVFVQSNSTDNK